jgi:hypothetical protein
VSERRYHIFTKVDCIATHIANELKQFEDEEKRAGNKKRVSEREEILCCYCEVD